MKFRKLLGGGLLAAVLALGGVAGLATHSESKSVSAADGPVSGTITVDLTGGWASNAGDEYGNGQNITVYFWDNDNHNGWGSYEYAAYNEFVAFVEYDLDFTPTNMKAVRFSNWWVFDPADPWAEHYAEKGWEKTPIWNDTQDLVFVENGNIIADTNNDYTKVGYAFLWGKAKESDWGWSNRGTLDSVQLDSSNNHVVYYLTKTFTQWEQVEIRFYENGIASYDATTFSANVDSSKWTKQDTWWLQYTAEDPITINIKYDRNSNKIYLDDVATGSAYDWAQDFLNGMKCSGEGSINKDKWSILSGTYNELLPASKALFEEVPTHGDEHGTLIEQAVCRYDFILIKYGIGTSAPKHTDFMGRFGENGINKNVPTAQAPISIFGSMDNSTPIMLVVIISVVSLTAVGGYIFLKRRKED